MRPTEKYWRRKPQLRTEKMSISGSDESAPPPRDGVESLDGADSGKREAVLPVVSFAGGSATADSSVAVAAAPRERCEC